jgi:nitroreductase
MPLASRATLQAREEAKEGPMSDLWSLIRERRSVRAPFDPDRPISTSDLGQILEAARWSPTAHNMQNFEVIVVDDRSILAELEAVSSPVSETFIRENFAQLSFSEEELRRKKVGILAAGFPAAWTAPGADFARVARESGPSYLRDTIRSSPTLLVVAYDARKRAPASEGDVLGFLSLGCLMENMWLAAQSLGVACQIMSAFSGDAVEPQVKRILGIPGPMRIAFAMRLGYPPGRPFGPVRVRREVADFAYRNRYGAGFKVGQPGRARRPSGRLRPSASPSEGRSSG